MTLLYDRPHHLSGAPVMNLNSLLCSLLAAYACGASGTYEKPRREA
ncbi:lipoprotein, putative [Pseudomonas fluorescens Q2-87]|uniref:Lipoprotein, putative n=1 Tax=Pseudomonas fluorescens (strain Q2-87) TaxID=1038922 RepID=J2YDQ7_PSEFQ|nr:lipoprotein, putative [Pseudomonas fluorescens Q2-87]